MGITRGCKSVIGDYVEIESYTDIAGLYGVMWGCSRVIYGFCTDIMGSGRDQIGMYRDIIGIL